jgi:hypothetical protein
VGSKVKRDYRSQFRGLSGSGIPSGNHEARIACSDDALTQTKRFGEDTREARLIDPEPGVYLVSMHSTSDYGCVSEVEFAAFSSHWIHWICHPPDCSFEFDRFANLIRRDSSHKPVPSQWSEEMRKYKQDFRREFEKAVDRQ